MGRNLPDFHFNSFGIDHTITPSNANDSVAFKSFTISWNLNRGYKTKVRTLPPKRSTITSNEEKIVVVVDWGLTSHSEMKKRKLLSQWKDVIISILVLLNKNV